MCPTRIRQEPAAFAVSRRPARNYGVRVQYSVFECRLEAKDWVVLKDKLLSEYDSQRDSLRFYYVSIDDAHRVEHYGVRRPLDPTGPLVV